MIEIKYTKEEISLKMDKELNVLTMKCVLTLLDKVKEFNILEKTVGEEAVKIAASSIPIQRGEIIRERLPNNTVDPSKLETSKNEMGKHTHFRCSECGQSVVTVVNGNVIIRDLENKEENLCITKALLEDFNYEDAKTKVTDVGVSLISDGNTKAFCPMCLSEKLIELWVDAYENPLKYFEYENPCPICGSETVFNINATGKPTIKCDNEECGYEIKEEE